MTDVSNMSEDIFNSKSVEPENWKGFWDSFNAVVVTRGDLTNFDDYNNATEDQKDRIWEITKHKLPDMLLQDYDICLEYCIERGLEN